MQKIHVDQELIQNYFLGMIGNIYLEEVKVQRNHNVEVDLVGMDKSHVVNVVDVGAMAMIVIVMIVDHHHPEQKKMGGDVYHNHQNLVSG